MKSIVTQAEGARLRYLELEGSGTPLILIHGLGCAGSFEYLHVARAPALADRHCLLVDLLGFGYSDRPENFTYAIRDHARSLAELVEDRGFPEVCLYGHSMGGSIAIELADLLGERVKNLILSEANLRNGKGQFSRTIAEMGEETYLSGGHERVISIARRGGNEAWASMMAQSLPLAVYRSAASLLEGSSPEWGERLIAREGPKTFIFGEHSLPDPDEALLRGGGVPLLTIPKVGHSMATENPQALAAAIAEALSNGL